jgi:hypothetical protein
VRSRVIERRNRLGSPAVDHLADPVVDLIKRRLPRDLLELSRALQPDPAQRVQQALRPVHERGHIACDFGTDDPDGERHRFGAAHFRDAPSSTVTVRLQVSGQSKVQTLGCSSRDIRRLRAETATIDYPYVWCRGYNSTYPIF